MSNNDAKDANKLNMIADALGISAERIVFGDDFDTETAHSLECVRLWLAIRTAEGRAQALKCLRHIIDDEQA